MRVIEACAELGVPTGLNKLGALMETGASGVVRDAYAAVELYELAAEASGLGYEERGGQCLGRFNLGWALVHGEGTVRDRAAGLEQWRKAAAMAPDDGAEEAAYNLYDELGDTDEGFEYLELSADLGFDPALEKFEEFEEWYEE